MVKFVIGFKNNYKIYLKQKNEIGSNIYNIVYQYL